MYKDYQGIAKIQDRFLQMALILLDTECAEAMRLITAFPECFTKTASAGPIPLSVLKKAEEMKCQNNADWDAIDSYLVSHNVIGENGEFNLPIISFAHSEKVQKEFGCDYTIPDKIGTEVKFGEIIQFEEKDLVVVENNAGGWIECVPAECVTNDLEK
jgi:hypothetical protein